MDAEVKSGPSNDVAQGIAEMLGESLPTEESAPRGKESTQETPNLGDDFATEKGAEVESDKSSTEEPAAEEPKNELEQRLAMMEKQNQKLMDQLNALLEQQQTVKTKEVETKTQELQDFLQGTDVIDLTEDPKKFNTFLNDFQQKVKQSTIEEILTKLPQVIMDYTNHQLTIKSSVDSFYQDHPELQPMKKYVAKIMGDISSENPDWTLDKVLEEGAKRSYDGLGIQKGKAKAKPAFTNQTTTNRKATSEDLSPLEKQLEAILNI